jgi:Leucine-rich repeat (LRR) protein
MIYAQLFILISVSASLLDAKPKKQLALKSSALSSSCIFIGCSCSKDRIKCPADTTSLDYDTRLTMFPKRYIGKAYANNITLLLSDNHLEMIPDDRFAGLDITRIDLSNNRIFKLSAYTFRDIAKLEELDLNTNLINYLNSNLFEPVEASLQSLNLEQNSLNEMETSRLSSAFQNLKKLKNLNLAKNKLVYIPNLTKLSLLALSLSMNQIEILVDADSYKNLLPVSLIELDLEQNRLKQINDNSFEGLKELRHLNLASNEISAIAESSFLRLTSLMTLNLRQNNIKHIPSKIFYTLVNLEQLDLSYQSQRLEQIDDYAFDRQSNRKTIKRVDLSSNRIVAIESRAFCSKNYYRPFVNIKELDLSANPIKNVNSCLLRQLAKGFNDSSLPSRQRNPAKVVFKTSELDAPVHLECSCEVVRASKFVEMQGGCRRADNLTVASRFYDCGDSITSISQLNKHCSSFVQFDCSQSADLRLVDVDYFNFNPSTSSSTAGYWKSNYSSNGSSNSSVFLTTTLPVELSRNSTFNLNDDSKEDHNDNPFDNRFEEFNPYQGQNGNGNGNLNETNETMIAGRSSQTVNLDKFVFILCFLISFFYF